MLGSDINSHVASDPYVPSYLLVSFAAIAFYNIIELQVMIWVTFKRRTGLYFYSVLLASWGTLATELGLLVFIFDDSAQHSYVLMTVIKIGWCLMVTGQSLVLYSRLHLVLRDHTKLKWVLWMIIVDAIIFHIPIIVLYYGVRSTLLKY